MRRNLVILATPTQKVGSAQVYRVSFPLPQIENVRGYVIEGEATIRLQFFGETAAGDMNEIRTMELIEAHLVVNNIPYVGDEGNFDDYYLIFSTEQVEFF